MNTRLSSLLSGLCGGLSAGGALGLFEAFFHLSTSGAPDLLSPLYGATLYGLLGAGFGAAAGALVAAFPPPAPEHERWRIALAHCLGVVFAVVPMLGFIALYLGNKVVYAEQGVPLTGKLVILVVLALFSLNELTVMVRLGAGPMFRVIRPSGSVAMQAVFMVVGGLVALLPRSEDPRSDMAHARPAPAALSQAPDVLIITVDTLRADHLGAYGFPTPISPVLDGIAADGIVFEDASAHASWTRSSFASLWTSRLPTAHQADTKASRLSDDLVLLSEVLHDAGMTTGNLANNINVTETFNFDQGYDTFVYEAPDYHFGATESVFSLTFYKVVHKLREKLGGAKKVESFYQPADVVLADARTFIEANADARWMLGVHLMEPHDPYFEHPYLDGSGTEQTNGIGFARAEVESPSLDQADYLKRVYADEVRHMDRLLEPFISWLKDSGRYDRTTIVITADHGEEFGEHGGFWHGTTLYQEQTHVPLIVKLPNQDLAGTRVGWQARLIDVAPTLTGVLGLKADPSWAGRDLLGDVRAELDEAAALAVAVEDARSTVDGLSEGMDAGTLDDVQLEELREAQRLLEGPELDPCTADARDRVVVSEQDFEGNVLAALVLGGRKLITANEGNPRGLATRELFELGNDPTEQVDLLDGGTSKCVAQPGTELGILEGELSKALEQAESGAVEAEDVEVDAGETCRLCALGYMSGPACDDC